jgi:hypothetical protein
MIGCIRTALISIGSGFLLCSLQDFLKTSYLSDFLKNNLISLLIALLAINSATLSVVLTKIRELVDKHGGLESFRKTRNEMIISLREQITLIILGTILLMSEKSIYLTQLHCDLFLHVAICAIFIYSMIVLYDTAKSVFAILDFDPKA